MSLKKLISIGVTLLIFIVAALTMRSLWVHYMDSPWTRDGRVRAEIINIAPDVAGLVTEIAVKDNQKVKKGDLIMTIDDSHYKLAVEQAKAQVKVKEVALAQRLDDQKRRIDINELVISREERSHADHFVEAAKAELNQAKAELNKAELNLKRTRVIAPIDGSVTHLNVFAGDYLERGQGALALVDQNSFYVYGYFEETRLPLIEHGATAQIHLLSGQRLTGKVDSIARGVFDRDNPSSAELVADVNPTFNWVRLARRIPVRITLDPVPDDVLLAAGLTCTVVITESTAPLSPLDRWF